MTFDLTLTPPAPFDFPNTAHSHGWVVLAPTSWDADTQTMQRVERLSGGKVVRLEIRGTGTARKPAIAILAESRGRLGKKDQAEITEVAARMLRFDEDLRPFYKLCRKKGGHWRKVTTGLGRLLASPTVFEDVVKVICTTNIQWGGTKKMAAGVVEAFGDPFIPRPELRAFPTPEAIAAVTRGEFAGSVRMGYRAPYVHELAERVATGDLDLEALRERGIPTAELKKRLLAIKGIGPYAAATMLMLLGRYDDLGIDTVCRDFTAKKYFKGRKPADDEIRAIYEEWGEWRYLAYWFDIWAGVNEVL